MATSLLSMITHWRQEVPAAVEVGSNFVEDQEPKRTSFEELETDFLIDLHLFRSLYGVLIAAISQGDQSICSTFIHTELVLIRYKLNRLPPVLHRLGKVTLTILEQLSQSLKDVLELLNKVVLDNVIEQEGCETQSRYSDNTSAYPRLISLHRLTYLQDKSSRHPINDSIGLETFSPLDALIASQYVKFRLSFSEEKQLRSRLRNFSEALEQLEHLTVDHSAHKTSPPEESADKQSTIDIARKAQEFWQRVNVLYKYLVTSFQDCQTEHIVQLCLSELGFNKDDLGVCFSLCSVAPPMIWHQGTMRCSIHDRSEGSSVNDLCEYLRVSSRKHRPVSLVLTGDSVRKTFVEGRIAKSDRQPSFIDLETVLTSLNNSGQEGRTEFESSDARRLQCLLAQSLLLFHHSSWIPDTLSLADINFVINGTAFDLKNPYIPCALRSIPVDNAPVELHTLDNSEAAHFIIRFGLLLLQIERGQSLTLTEEKVEDEEYDGHELALERYYSEFEDILDQSEDVLDKSLLPVLHDCLNFKDRLENNIYQHLPPELRIRFFVQHHILEPLNKSLARKFPKAAAEILPLEAERDTNNDELRPLPVSFVDRDKLGLGSHTDSHIGRYQMDTIIEVVEAGQEPVSSYVSQISDSTKETYGLMIARESLLSSAKWFSNLGRLTAVLDLERRHLNSNYKRVRIAILDSGIDPMHPAFVKERYKDCIKTPRVSRPGDFQHGTDSVNLILKVFEHAELYIARVYQDLHGDEKTAMYMADAIEWAIEKQVDIISISAGLDNPDDAVETAINRATGGFSKDPSQILIFASAGNHGATDSIAYPARYTDRVFCVFSTNCGCKESRELNPSRQDNANNFAIFGEKVELYPSAKPLNGTSMATAIAAGLAGRLLDFSRHADSYRTIPNRHKLQTKQGMTAVFKLMSEGHKDNGYDCMVPWDLLPQHNPSLDQTEKRQHVAAEIKKVLSHL